MPRFQQAVLTTAYLPPAEYFYAIAHSGRVLIEQCETYLKQSYRTRCRIFSSQGMETLSIPVLHPSAEGGSPGRIPIRDVRIDYGGPWIVRHKRALEASYNSSAFFPYYKDAIFSVLDRRETFLFDLNLLLLEKILSLLGLKADIVLTDEFRQKYDEGDFRERIQPKYRGKSLLEEYGALRPWFQVFEDRTQVASKVPGAIAGIVPGTVFIPNLSIVDLLSAEGPDSLSFLE